MAAGRKWTRDELLVALNIYRKLKFGQLDARTPVIKDLAAKLHRSPNSVAMKLCNIASLDPLLRARGIRGLEGASNLDRQIWAEFQENPLEISSQSEAALRALVRAPEDGEVEVEKNSGIKIVPPSGPTEQLMNVKVRRSQQFFRQMILNAFDSRCCITGVPIRELLVASHILPWSKFPEERLNPENGLCLSRLHDGAFDTGFIAFDNDCRMIVSKRLKKFLPQKSLNDNFERYEGLPLNCAADAIPPRPEFLRYHRDKIFVN
ncbi:MAG TPA: HNH endonuclease [Verrucomicrobiae bacterium]